MRHINSFHNFKNENSTSSFLCLPVYMYLSPKTSFTTDKFLPHHLKIFWTRIECSWPLFFNICIGDFGFKISNDMARVFFCYSFIIINYWKIDIESNTTSQWIYHQENTPKSLTRCRPLSMTSRYKYLQVDVSFIQHT